MEATKKLFLILFFAQFWLPLDRSDSVGAVRRTGNLANVKNFCMQEFFTFAKYLIFSNI